MKKLREHLQDYLTLRRKCGFKLRVQGGLLAQFVRFAEAPGGIRDHTACLGMGDSA